MAYCVTLEDFISRTEEIDGLIPENVDAYTVLNNGLNLKQMRDNAEENLRGLLSLLGYSNGDPIDNMRDLNRRIQEFHATTASFNGPRLRMEIINPLKGVVMDDMALEVRKFQDIVQSKQQEIGDVFLQLVDQVTVDLAGDGDVSDVLASDIAAEMYAQMNQVIFNFNTGSVTVHGAGAKGGGGKFVSKDYKELTEKVIKKLKSGIQTANFSGGVDPNIKQLINKDISFSRRLLLLAQSRGINVDHIYEQAVSAPVFHMEESGDGLNIYFDILKPFLEVMAPSDAKGTKAEKAALAYFEGLPPDKKEQETQRLVSRATEYFDRFFDINSLDATRAEQLRGKFNQAIYDIVYNYPASLFVGRNEQGVIGILGEIQGLYYIYSILGDLNPQIDPKTLIEWIGGDTGAGGGVKTGADLIVKISEKLGYGIQIKNSMDLTGETSFSDFVLTNDNSSAFFTQLVGFGIDSSIVSALEDVFTMKSFNIGYHKAGTIAVKGAPKGPNATVYLGTYSKLLELVDRANRYMAIAAAMIMRIQYLQQQNFMQTNTLWIVGGTAIISAAQILDDLIKQVDGELNGNMFRSSATTKFGDTGFTIVDYLNGKHKQLSDLKTTLKTSYNFHKVS